MLECGHAMYPNDELPVGEAVLALGQVVGLWLDMPLVLQPPLLEFAVGMHL